MKGQRSIPDWIRTSIPGGETYVKVKQSTQGKNLRTVCIEAKCPNAGECFCSGQAAFLILGSVCTRHCGYCAVSTGMPLPPDADEPRRIAEAVRDLSLSYAVITSVTRDDLPDGGASHFADCIHNIRAASACRIETLIPDFRNAEPSALDIVFAAKPDVINHNIEVVPRLFPRLRPQGSYQHSLQLLHRISGAGFPAKSGLMIGFGEERSDIRGTLQDLKDAGCGSLTVGQYLRSSKEGFSVKKYYCPEEFEEIRCEAEAMGFKKVLSGPMVRSSYHAEKSFSG
ncbi:MAG: lipoyl synthase [Spirochaetota bacterium]